jgi:7-carboxy-7-deazaguanine synthase
MNERGANLLELFSSVQGEGPFVGLRQIFIRFQGCNLKCRYCDTNIETVPASCNIEGTPGRRDFFTITNPVALDRVVSHLSGWNGGWPGIHHSISITGGEPLLEPDLLLAWLPVLRDIFPIYLETNGILINSLSRLIGFLDHISMDIKIPSTSGCSDLWDIHGDFLRIAAQKDVFVKVVTSDDTEAWEIERACKTVSSINKRIPVILQPVTLPNGKVGISPLRILEFQEIACRYLSEVRIIPQTHRFTGQI